MSTDNIMEAIHARKISGEETDLELYDLICKKVGLSVYDLRKLTGWSYGRVQKSIERLERAL